MEENSLSQTVLKLLQTRKGHSRQDKATVVAAVGGGGKTAVLYLLAEAFARKGRRVCFTTTTHIYDPRTEEEARGFDRVVILPELAAAPRRASPMPAESAPKQGSITILASEDAIPDSSVHQSEKSHRVLLKLGGIHPDWIAVLQEYWDVILVEADGSKHLPIKAPAEHEPVIPPVSDMVLGCIGLDCLGKPMDEGWVHRPQLFSLITGCGAGEPIEDRHFINLVLYSQGLFKASPPGVQRVLLLNKADLLLDGALRELEADFGFLRSGGGVEVLLGSAKRDFVYM